MKKVLNIFAIIMVFALSFTVLTACNDSEEPNENEVTVGWYYGSKLLREDKVEKGTLLESWTPEEEGKTFSGWFSEASATTPFDFTVAVNEDTDIFAAFKSDEYVEDTNQYYLCGIGAGDMGKVAWDHANGQANTLMTKQDVEKANVYKITLKMYAGDQFQICYGGSWDGQQGIGIMVGAEYCDGVNKYDGTEYKAEDKKVAQVKDASGTVVFVGSDEYNKGFEVWNIILAEGQDGVYEFTLTTYPNAKAYNTLEFKLVEKIDALTTTHDMHLIGAFNGWNAQDTENPLSESEDKNSWTGYITVTPEMYVDYGQADKNTTAIKVINHVDGVYYGDSTGENIFLSEGTWAVKYNVADNSVVCEKLEYYVVGTLIDADGKAVNYAVKEGVSPKLVSIADNTYSVEFTAYDATGLGDYSWMTDQGKTDIYGTPAIISIKVVFGSSLGIKDWYSAEGGDNWYLSAGTYIITLSDGSVNISAK